MSRPKRRCRGGLVTPKGTRPARRRGELPCRCPAAEELLLRSASAAAASDANLDEAEVWAASIQPLFHPGGLACGHALSPSKVLAAAEDCDDTAAAAAVAAAVAAYGPRGHRSGSATATPPKAKIPSPARRLTAAADRCVWHETATRPGRDLGQGRMLSRSQWLGLTTEKSRLSVVATVVTPRRSAATTTEASTVPRGKSRYMCTSSAIRSQALTATGST